MPKHDVDPNYNPSHATAKRGVVVPFVRSPYNYDTMAASDESGLFCDDPSLTSQAFLEESDINWIVDRFTRTGQLPDGVRQPQFGDYTDVPSDYHSALNQVRNAEMAFMTLPAKLRSQFDNDPGKLLAFLADDKNRDKAVELGIIAPKEDLSTPAPERYQAAGVGAGVEKSGQQAQASKKAVSAPEKGGEGDE